MSAAVLAMLAAMLDREEEESYDVPFATVFERKQKELHECRLQHCSQKHCTRLLFLA